MTTIFLFAARTILHTRPIYTMSGYDSDSSGSEGDYTETNVLLGYATKEPTDDTISQLGGHPVR